MSKPNWEDAPEWANFLVTDFDGNWIFFEYQPVYHKSGLFWVSNGRELKIPNKIKWGTYIEERPTNEQT